jgi:hypothetical protein
MAHAASSPQRCQGPSLRHAYAAYAERQLVSAMRALCGTPRPSMAWPSRLLPVHPQPLAMPQLHESSAWTPAVRVLLGKDNNKMMQGSEGRSQKKGSRQISERAAALRGRTHHGRVVRNIPCAYSCSCRCCLHLNASFPTGGYLSRVCMAHESLKPPQGRRIGADM